MVVARTVDLQLETNKTCCSASWNSWSKHKENGDCGCVTCNLVRTNHFTNSIPTKHSNNTNHSETTVNIFLKRKSTSVNLHTPWGLLHSAVPEDIYAPNWYTWTLNYYYYYYIHLMAFYSRTTWISRYQKGKPFWIWLEQEMMGWQWHQLDHSWTLLTHFLFWVHIIQYWFTAKWPIFS